MFLTPNLQQNGVRSLNAALIFSCAKVYFFYFFVFCGKLNIFKLLLCSTHLYPSPWALEKLC